MPGCEVCVKIIDGAEARRHVGGSALWSPIGMARDKNPEWDLSEKVGLDVAPDQFVADGSVDFAGSHAVLVHLQHSSPHKPAGPFR
jgi:hypothetical protein